MYIICLVSVQVSAFYFEVPCWMPYSPLGAQLLGFAPLQPLGVYPWQAYVKPGDGHWATPGIHRVAASFTTLSRGEPYATQSAVPQPSHLYGGAYSFGGLAESQLIPPPSLHGGEGSSFPGFVPSSDTVDSESVIGIKPGDFGMVMGYQVDEFTHTWSAEWFVAHSIIYPGFTGKVSSLTHFPLEPGSEDYSFLDQAMADFYQDLVSILTDSLETPEFDASLDEPDAVPSSVSSGFLHLVSTLSDNSKLQLATSIRSRKLWCQARALLAPMPLATKMSASKLICYFSSYPAAFGFQSLAPLDNITLTSANISLISPYQTCRLVLALLLMPLLTLSNSSPTSELLFLILFSLYLILREALYLCLKYVNYFSRFTTFWRMLFPNELGTLLVF